MIEYKSRRNGLKSIARIYEMKVTNQQDEEVLLLDVFLKAGLDPTDVSDNIYTAVEEEVRARDKIESKIKELKS